MSVSYPAFLVARNMDFLNDRIKPIYLKYLAAGGGNRVKKGCVYGVFPSGFHKKIVL